MKLFLYFLIRFLLLGFLTGVYCVINVAEGLGFEGIVLDLKNIDTSYFKIVKRDEIPDTHPEIFRFMLKPGTSKVITLIKVDLFNIWERSPEKNDNEFYYFDMYNTRNRGIMVDIHTSGSGGGETFQFNITGNFKSLLTLIEFYRELTTESEDVDNSKIKLDVNDKFDMLYHESFTKIDGTKRYLKFSSLYEEFIQVSDRDYIIWESKSPYGMDPNTSTQNQGPEGLSNKKELYCKMVEIYSNFNFIHLVKITLENDDIVYFKIRNNSALEVGRPTKLDTVNEEEFIKAKKEFGFEELDERSYEKILDSRISEGDNSHAEIDLSKNNFYLENSRISFRGIREVSVHIVGKKNFITFKYENQKIFEYSYGDSYRIIIVKSNSGTKYIEVISMTGGVMKKTYFALEPKETVWKKITNYEYDFPLKSEIDYESKHTYFGEVETIVDDLPIEVKKKINPDFGKNPPKESPPNIPDFENKQLKVNPPNIPDFENKQPKDSPTNNPDFRSQPPKEGGIESVVSSFKISKIWIVLLTIFFSLI
uniref:Uncharacterized protein n=1 Tax=Theileria annulata TaxID=5874 RepID=A0A3B0N2G5_THEAN